MSERPFLIGGGNYEAVYGGSPVYEEYKRTLAVVSELPPEPLRYEHRLAEYLRSALVAGMTDQSFLMSCVDLAETFSPEFKDEREQKRKRWQEFRKQALPSRLGEGHERRLIEMQLYPGFYWEILTRSKNVEGRAFDPQSDKIYQAIYMGDKIEFSVCTEQEGWEEECEKYGLTKHALMTTKVRDVFFSPTVHGILNFVLAGHIQPRHWPQEGGVAELLSLPHVAEYYRIPNYPERIKEHGFIGITIDRPRSISK